MNRPSPRREREGGSQPNLLKKKGITFSLVLIVKKTMRPGGSNAGFHQRGGKNKKWTVERRNYPPKPESQENRAAILFCWEGFKARNDPIEKKKEALGSSCNQIQKNLTGKPMLKKRKEEKSPSLPSSQPAPKKGGR